MLREQYPVVAGEDVISVAREWEDLRHDLARAGGGSVYVMGMTDCGKSTFCRYLAGELAGSDTVALLDCDTGQSSVGPPATVGVALYRGAASHPTAVHLRFVGSTSPRGHVPQFLTGARRLFDRARRDGARWVIIDSPGFVSGPQAQEFHFQMIDLLRPDHLVCFQHGHELDAISVNFARTGAIRIHRFAVSPAVKARSRIARAAFREDRFRDYFSAATLQEISIGGRGVHGALPGSFRPDAWKNLLVAFCDAEQEILALGIVQQLDLVRLAIRCLAPPFDRSRLASVHVGSMTIDLFRNPCGGENGETSRPDTF
jgi:polynucleotide 5'-hydroxyl-kinase GRC3/NOL9